MVQELTRPVKCDRKSLHITAPSLVNKHLYVNLKTCFSIPSYFLSTPGVFKMNAGGAHSVRNLCFIYYLQFILIVGEQ